MKKVDLFLGQDRETLTRDQMKAVTGGFADGTSHCYFSLSNDIDMVATCPNMSQSACRAYAEHNMHASEIAQGGTYACIVISNLKKKDAMKTLPKRKL